MEVVTAMAADPTETNLYVQLAKYGIVGTILAYFVYQDWMGRKRQVAKDEAEDKRRAADDERRAQREAAEALIDNSRERDCVEAIRKVELARTTELKDYLFKQLDAQAKTNSLYERLIKMLEKFEDETREYHRKHNHDGH